MRLFLWNEFCFPIFNKSETHIMKLLSISSLLVFTMFCFFGCVSGQKVQNEAPFTLDEVYYQNWTAGLKDGGSGFDFYLKLKEDLPKNVRLDSVYFKNEVAKLERKSQSGLTYIGRFLKKEDLRQDIVMSKDPITEYGNKLPLQLKSQLSIKMNENKCIISYQERNRIKYFKITNVLKKDDVYFPSTKPKY